MDIGNIDMIRAILMSFLNNYNIDNLLFIFMYINLSHLKKIIIFKKNILKYINSTTNLYQYIIDDTSNPFIYLIYSFSYSFIKLFKYIVI